MSLCRRGSPRSRRSIPSCRRRRIDDGLLIDDVELPRKLVFRAERDEDGPRIGVELLAHRH